MTRSKGHWQRVTKRRPCPVCSKPDWCVYAGPDDAPTAALCQRIESQRRIGEAGWLHRLRESVTAWPPWERNIRRAVRLATEARGGPDFGKLAADFRRAVKPEALGRLAATLGLSPESLQRLRVGWSARHRAWAFPMRDASARTVGIRLRLAGGRKLSVKGGREGLFIPTGLQPGGRLFVCEGPTDTAACLDWGFRAVGRPSCTGGVKYLAELVRRLAPAEVVIVADGDPPGQQGAERLASTLAAYVPMLRVITPPSRVKDARAWRASRVTSGDVTAEIERAPVRRLGITTKRKGRGKDARAKQH
jgi:hypothetical protein